jgi:hypothetical protein
MMCLFEELMTRRPCDVPRGYYLAARGFSTGASVHLCVSFIASTKRIQGGFHWDTSLKGDHSRQGNLSTSSAETSPAEDKLADNLVFFYKIKTRNHLQEKASSLSLARCTLNSSAF